ncbi:MAG: flippase-like domain-containing protein [Deltaproteobacteria bacterium]|nr:flippase-like domain-containing protein [Deltaproteobacteria bacterium]
MGLFNIRRKGLLKLIGPLLLLLFIVKIVDPRVAIELLEKVRPDIVLMSIGLFPVIIAIRTFRWWIICRHLDMGTTFKQLFQTYYISWFVGILPLSGVSVISKIFYLKQDGKSAVTALLSISLDKLFDIVGLIIFGFLGFIYFPKDLFDSRFLFALYGGLIFTVIMVLIFKKRVWAYFNGFLKKFLNKKFQQLGRNLEKDLSGFWSSFTLRSFLVIMGLSIAIGLLRSFVLYVLAIALGMHASFFMLIGCRALIGVANILPITVNGLGTRDAILLLTLPLSGFSREAALALGFLAFLWAVCFKFSGIFFWLKHPLPSREVATIKERFHP